MASTAVVIGALGVKPIICMLCEHVPFQQVRRLYFFSMFADYFSSKSQVDLS